VVTHVSLLKYKDLVTEIQCMWYVKAKVIPVSTGGIKTISKSLRQYLKNIIRKARNQGTTCTQTAIFGNAHILQKVLI
jgi:hypothetical protein